MGSFFKFKFISRFLILVVFSSLFGLSVSVLQSDAIRLNETVWYLRSASAASAFGTTGPSSEQSLLASDLNSASPTNKTTALAMTKTPGSLQTSVVGTETSLVAGSLWYRTFLSPKLAAQTLPSGTTFRLEGALAENSLSANMILRIHVYVWREGTGYVTSLFDGVPSTSCGGEPGAANSERSAVCVTSGTALNVSLSAGDQIALEVWVNANNASATSFSGTFYFEGTNFIGDGTASHVVSSALSTFTVSAPLDLYSNADTSTVWFLSSTSSASAWGRTGPTSEYSAATDNVPAAPVSKTTAKAMTDSVAGSQTSLTFTETSATTVKAWLSTFLSPPLAAQTIPAGTVFRFEGSTQENGTLANMSLRLHLYIWREGTGYVSSLLDNVSTLDCDGEAGIAQESTVCLTTALASPVSLQDGDQIAFEPWAFANNTSTSSYSYTFFYEGNGLIENGVSAHPVSSARSALSVSVPLQLLTSLSVDVVDSSGSTVASPSVSFSSANYSPVSQTTTATLGASSAKIRLENWSSSNSWTLSLAPTLGSTAAWSNGSSTYDFNDSVSALDGADADSVGGQLSVNPSVSTLSAAYGCNSTTGVSKGSSSAYNEGVVNSISLLVGSGSASYNCAWDLTGVSLSQLIPGYQPGGSPYSLSLTLSAL